MYISTLHRTYIHQKVWKFENLKISQQTVQWRGPLLVTRSVMYSKYFEFSTLERV